MAEPARPRRPDANELIRRRHDKLDALRARGIDPFGGRFPVTHWAGRAARPASRTRARTALTDAGAVALAGRVISLRHHGKTCFAHLHDMTGRIQLYARADALGDALTRLHRPRRRRLRRASPATCSARAPAS